MTAVEWAKLVLPLLALAGGIVVVCRNCAAIDVWIRMLDAWLEIGPGQPPAAAPVATRDCNLRGADL